MANKRPTAIARLRQDYLRIKRDPIPFITAEPLPSNILEWHYVVRGPEDSPYEGGFYHGTLSFPREFPFKPPSIYMITPNGRFKTNTRLCLSISDFHPDTWNPAWSVSTILTGLLSFMLENTPTLGSTKSFAYEKQQLARESIAFNLKNPIFCELFPDIAETCTKILEVRKEEQSNRHANGVAGTNDPNSQNIRDLYLDNNSNWQSIHSNVTIIISLIIFAMIVNYVFKSLKD
uniref:Ubiquitin-conjugating enzyme E2 J2 n=1 Tax=Tabanus bromius TaxID=304241 RepID=A0A0K8TQ93_TABBR